MDPMEDISLYIVLWAFDVPEVIQCWPTGSDVFDYPALVDYEWGEKAVRQVVLDFGQNMQHGTYFWFQMLCLGGMGFPPSFLRGLGVEFIELWKQNVGIFHLYADLRGWGKAIVCIWHSGCYNSNMTPHLRENLLCNHSEKRNWNFYTKRNMLHCKIRTIEFRTKHY